MSRAYPVDVVPPSHVTTEAIVATPPVTSGDHGCSAAARLDGMIAVLESRSIVPRTPDIAMVAYWFPPCRRWPTAATRADGLARGLADRGWSTTVVAPDLGDGCPCGGCGDPVTGRGPVDVLRVPVRPWRVSASAGARIGSVDVRADRSTVQRIAAPVAALFELRNDWVAAATKAIVSAPWAGSLGAVWTTSPPFRSVVIGSRVRSALGVPWVADLRDEISRVRGQDPTSPTAVAARLGRRPLRRHLRRADRVVAVTDQLARIDAAWLGRPVDTIMSGFDQALWESTSPARTDDFVITYAGTFYPGYIGPDLAIRGIVAFARSLPPPDRDRLRLVYLGREHEIIGDALARAGGGVRLETPGFVTGDPYRTRLKGSTVLLHLSNQRGEGGVPGGKLYDYLAARRPILSVPGTDPFVADVLSRTGTGTTAATAPDVAAELHRWHGRWRAGTGVPAPGDAEQVARFSLQRAADELDHVLRAAIGRRHG